jgi:hypothetical protein
MEWQREDGLQPVGSNLEGPSEGALKKAYQSPELQEWGSIQELTQGGDTLGKNDFPKKNGSRPT